MISKWFIGVKAKSKGFITGWNDDDCYSYHRTDNTVRTEARPSFTKQSALAVGYATKEEGDAIVAEYINVANNKLKEAEKKLELVNTTKDKWSTLSFDQRVDFCKAVEPKVSYTSTRTYNKSTFQQTIYFKNRGTRNQKDWSEEEIEAINSNIDWKREVKHKTNYVDLYKNRIDFCQNKMIVREQEIEIKFMDKERRKLSWSNREENDTQGDYCNCCGGAVSGVPQLCISGNRWGERTIICGICMGRLAQESAIQVSKIPKEILKHYQADRFLRSMD